MQGTHLLGTMSFVRDSLARAVDVVGGEGRMVGDLLGIEDDFDAVRDGELADELLSEERVEGLLLRSLGANGA